MKLSSNFPLPPNLPEVKQKRVPDASARVDSAGAAQGRQVSSTQKENGINSANLEKLTDLLTPSEKDLIEALFSPAKPGKRVTPYDSVKTSNAPKIFIGSRIDILG